MTHCMPCVQLWFQAKGTKLCKNICHITVMSNHEYSFSLGKIVVLLDTSHCLYIKIRFNIIINVIGTYKFKHINQIKGEKRC